MLRTLTFGLLYIVNIVSRSGIYFLVSCWFLSNAKAFGYPYSNLSSFPLWFFPTVYVYASKILLYYYYPKLYRDSPVFSSRSALALLGCSALDLGHLPSPDSSKSLWLSALLRGGKKILPNKQAWESHITNTEFRLFFFTLTPKRKDRKEGKRETAYTGKMY